MLTNRAAAIKGGESGAAIVPGEPDESLLVEAINYDSYEMPPSGKLAQKDIDLLRRWIQAGAIYSPNSEMEPAPVAHGSPQVTAQARKFWSFRTVERPAVPHVKFEGWVRNPIDSLVLSRLESAGLRPAAPASKEVLLRRAYYDLTGLPPTPAEVEAFLADDSPDAYARVIDHLLESPHYGEKWGRHWLDLVRYAETNSYERDGAKPHVWRYRDYVIRSLNADKPYDQFILEQLAGDELDQVTQDSIIATGYYRLGIWDDEPSDPQQAFFDDLDDIIMTTGQTFLGLTINCARCHDHKLDPIPQADYYRFSAFFRNIRRYGDRGPHTVLASSVREIGTESERQKYHEQVTAYEEELRKVDDEIKQIERKVRPRLVGVERDEFKREANRVAVLKEKVPDALSQVEYDKYVDLFQLRERLRKEKPAGAEQALCVKERGPNPLPTHILIRGNAHAEAAEVQPGFPSVLVSAGAAVPQPRPTSESTGRRRVLAEWIASPDNPLTARVMANRIWQHHFGRGLVASSNNFGFQGDPPTHPDLLDWLAAELVDGGWRLKRLHKLIMMSSTYQMSSQENKLAEETDPRNDLFWRFNMRRLTAEEIRDSILAVNGSLNAEKMYGPSIYTEIPREVLAGQSRPGAGWGSSSPEDRVRRSIYIHVKRSLVPPELTNFDFADTDTPCPVRFATTQPTQALGMLNSKLINDQARVLANFVKQTVGSDRDRQVEFALSRVLQRQPSEKEVARGVDLIERLQTQDNVAGDEALKHFCLVALNLNEFVYLD